MPFVLGCSMAMAWVFSDEATSETDKLLRSLRNDHAVVPTLWQTEVGNVLLAATRRGRIGQGEWKKLTGSLAALPVEMDTECHERIFTAVMPLAEEFDLTVYDAIYLELAVRRGLPLATLDKSLVRACGAAGVEVR
jgi:predicted nucleic acid-binding protein